MKWDRKTPCASCPYRRDAPRGMWHPEEFTGVLVNDRNPVGAVFGCHEFNKRPAEEHRPCAGWLLDQKRRNVPNLRLRLMLGNSDEAAQCFNEANEDGVDLFDSIKEMIDENMKYMKHGRTEVKEYEIFKVQGMGAFPIGLVVRAMTKKEAVKVARKRNGSGTYVACESSPEIRAEQARRVEETLRKMAEQAAEVPTLVVGEDFGLRSQEEG